MTFLLHNKSALVTGAASGIGRAAAIRFAQEGAQVCLADINRAGLEAVADEIGEQAFTCSLDVTDANSYQRCIDQMQERFGAVDIAFLNAGYLGPMEGFESLDAALFDRHININLKGVFFGLKALLPAMAAGGSVVVTASTAGVIGLAESPAYAAAKHGVIGLVKSCAAAFAARDSRVNVICPGAVDTPMIGGGNSGIATPESLPRIPLRGSGSAQHVAELAVWLVSSRAGFVNGQAHIIDAGLLSTFVPAPVGP